jgi:hypothetical protein
MFLMQAAFVGAKPPHLMASSINFDSAASTLNRNNSRPFKTKPMHKNISSNNN